MIEIGLGFGSNIGDKAGEIYRAGEKLVSSGHIFNLRFSSLYRTAPWGNIDQDWFVNGCALADTDLEPEALLKLAQSVELQMGRKRIVHWGPRNIDIDVLFYGDISMETPHLTLPHAQLLNRAFVLVPLLELKPNLKLHGRRVADSLAKLDASEIIPLV